MAAVESMTPEEDWAMAHSSQPQMWSLEGR